MTACDLGYYSCVTFWDKFGTAFLILGGFILVGLAIGIYLWYPSIRRWRNEINSKEI